MKIINKNETSSTIIVHGNNLKKQIAFTYDTGFEYLEAEEILKVLKFHKIKCTFFITGIWAKKFPELLNTMVREGHEIGNHSLDHHYMTKISYNDMIKTVIDGEKAIEEITGLKTTLFRLPFGHWNDEVLKAVYESGYKYNIYWSIDTLDWSIPSIQSIINKILGKLKNGDIVLMHTSGLNTAEATDRTIINLKARKYELVTVSSILV